MILHTIISHLPECQKDSESVQAPFACASLAAARKHRPHRDVVAYHSMHEGS